MKERIGFIGLGAMGLPMLRNVVRNGYSVTAYDIAPNRLELAVAEGARGATTCRMVAQNSDIVISIVPTAEDVKSAILGPEGVLEAARPGLTVIEMSTIDAATIVSLSATLAERRIDLLGAPVVRGVKAAVNGTLAIYVGGDPVVFERCRPLLSVMGTDIEYCGAAGTGNTVKIVNNMIVGITVCMLAEAMVLAVKGGVDTDVLFKCLSAGSANSFVLQNHIKDHVLCGDFPEGMFSIDNELKDLSLALAAADNLGVPQTFGTLAYQTYQQARSLGLARRYYPAVFEVAERIAGVKVRTSAGQSARGRT